MIKGPPSKKYSALEAVGSLSRYQALSIAGANGGRMVHYSRDQPPAETRWQAVPCHACIRCTRVPRARARSFQGYLGTGDGFG